MFSNMVVSFLLFFIVIVLFYAYSMGRRISVKKEARALSSLLFYAGLLSVIAFMMSLATLLELF